MSRVNNVATSLQSVKTLGELARFTGAAFDSIVMQMNGKLDFGDNVRCSGPFNVALGVDTNTNPATTDYDFISGNVTSAGAVGRGAGFTSARNSVGSFTVTFNSAFNSTPVATVTLENALLGPGTYACAYITAISASAFTVTVVSGTPTPIAATDIGFDFMSRGLVTVTSSTSTTTSVPVKVEHGLGRQPQGVLIIDQNSAASIYAPDKTLYPWDSTQIWLVSNADVDATIFVI